MWATGPNAWNQFAALKDAGGEFVTFDPPLQLNYTVPTGAAYGAYAGRNIVLQYNGFGDLFGIPGKCVSLVTNEAVSCNTAEARYVPEFMIPFGKAKVVREGTGVTLVTYGATLQRALTAANAVAEEGIDVEVIDPRTLSPLDEGTIIGSVEKTGALVVVDESPPHCSVASEIAAVVSEKAFDFLNAPVRRVTAPHAPVPFAPSLENVYPPSVQAIIDAVHSIA